MASSLGKMPTTSVRRLISPLRRSNGLVLWIFGRWSLGKLIKARTSASAWSIRMSSFGVAPVRWTVGDLGRLGFPEHLRLIGNWGEIADAGVATSGIVPPLDVAEDRHPGLGLRCEPAACQQLAFQCGEEALAHGVVVGVTDRPHGWEHAGFPAAPAERQRCILATLVA